MATISKQLFELIEQTMRAAKINKDAHSKERKRLENNLGCEMIKQGFEEWQADYVNSVVALGVALGAGAEDLKAALERNGYEVEV